jgi:hypothetical protein
MIVLNGKRKGNILIILGRLQAKGKTKYQNKDKQGRAALNASLKKTQEHLQGVQQGTRQLYL